MPIQFDKFDQQKVDNLKAHLDSAAQKGTPKSYEIHVDGVKAVMRTNDPEEFYNYEPYLKENTDQLKIIIYSSNNSPRNDQYAFSMQAKNQSEAFERGLDGLGGKAYSSSELKEQILKRQKQLEDMEELEMLRVKVADQEKKIKENNELIDTMQKIIDKAKENANKIGGVHLGDIASIALEGFFQRHGAEIAKAAGLEGLAGIFKENNNANKQNTQEEGANFRKKDDSQSVALTDKEKEFLALFIELEKHFNQQEMLQIIDILQILRDDKSQLIQILELILKSK